VSSELRLGDFAPGHPSDRRGHCADEDCSQEWPKAIVRDAEAAGRSALDGDLGRLKTGAAGPGLGRGTPRTTFPGLTAPPAGRNAACGRIVT
jgi:hypothetical protein